MPWTKHGIQMYHLKLVHTAGSNALTLRTYLGNVKTSWGKEKLLSKPRFQHPLSVTILRGIFLYFQTLCNQRLVITLSPLILFQIPQHSFN